MLPQKYVIMNIILKNSQLCMCNKQHFSMHIAYYRRTATCTRIVLNILQTQNLFVFLLNFFDSRSKCFLAYKYYYRNFSVFKNEISDFFKKEYGNEDVMNNDSEAIELNLSKLVNGIGIDCISLSGKKVKVLDNSLLRLSNENSFVLNLKIGSFCFKTMSYLSNSVLVAF